jgi:hypothetical protein
MNTPMIHILNACRKFYAKSTGREPLPRPVCDQNPDSSSEIIYNALTADAPCMITRFGINELDCVVNYMGIRENKRKILSYIKGNSLEWWWRPEIFRKMYVGPGFFPSRPDTLERFCKLMLQDIPEVDILGSAWPAEFYVSEELKNAQKISFELLSPYFSKIPWTRALKKKRILVVHPFSATIEQQYKKRSLLFTNDLLPEFDLQTIKAVQSIAGTKAPFTDWFEALEYMKSKIDELEYDICLLGCGAYGFPLAAHVKRKGKKSFHLGGSLQLLFGIRGKRWEDSNYSDTYNYARLMNEHWVRPSERDTPARATDVEGACYW